MVLSLYSKSLLEFVYNLTKTEKVLNPLELSKFLGEQGFQVSDRTIKRWFSYLKEHLGYFLSINYSSLGLINIDVLVKEPHKDIIKAVPYAYYLFSGFDATSIEDYTIISCLIPNRKLNEFKIFWDKAKEKNLLKDYRLSFCNNIVDFYSPFHEVITNSGNFEFSECIEHSVEPLIRNMQQPKDIKMSSVIEGNPLILPIVIEYSRERWSSYKVWNAIKEKLGDGVWDYINDIHYRNRRTDNSGIAFVQKTWKKLQENNDELFHNVRVVYRPLYTKKHSVSYKFLKLKNRKNLPDLVKEISKRSVNSVVYLPEDISSKEVTIFTSTNTEQESYIIRKILPKYINKSYDNKIIYMDFEETDKFWKYDSYRKYLKLDYANLFNPKNCTWKFDLREYLDKLDKITSPSQ